MKLSVIVVLFFLFPLVSVAQSKFAGEYYNNFSSTLKLNPDSTFEYTWRFDLSSSWTAGKWTVSNDTIYLNIVPVYDTVLVKNGDIMVDSLVLSLDGKGELIPIEESVIGVLTSGGQNRYPIHEKLYYSRNRLIEVDEDGRLKNKKIKNMWGKKNVPWYIKKEEK